MNKTRLFSILILFFIAMMLPQGNRQAFGASREGFEDNVFLQEEDGKSDFLVFLPMLTNGDPKPTTVAGQVTLNGNPYPGALMELYFYDAYGNIDLYKSTTTEADGIFQFIDIEPLGINEDYFVYFPNEEMNDQCLSWWESNLISSLQAGQTFTLPTFEVANVVLVSPAPGTTTAIPTTFRWNARPDRLHDDYELNLLDWVGRYYVWWTNPTLGNTFLYTLNGLPSGLSYNYDYGWDVWIYNETGAGSSYYYHRIQFSDSGKAFGGDQYIVLQERFTHDPLKKLR